ncbi:hypothetical protein AB3Y40_03840 [Yoonia sp. R2331]|uniref:hypothetical protein n=1 Tax=Yoonia sp. R2331 TaxID=3237238 RepID=UPI0034E50408
MWHKFKEFRADQDGAISVDWVVLTAGIMLFAGVVATLVKDGAVDGGNDIGTHVAAMATP